MNWARCRITRALDKLQITGRLRASSLRLRVDGLEAQPVEDTLELAFCLGAGEFATAVLRELGDFTTTGTPA